MPDTDLMPVVDGFPRPDWDAIFKLLDGHTGERLSELWDSWVEKWLTETAQALTPGYGIAESPNFLVLSAESDQDVTLLLRFFEGALNHIANVLDGIAQDDGGGKHVVLIFSDQDSYYRYISYFYPEEGEFPLSAGTFLDRDYGHFVFPYLDMNDAQATAAHELTHACLRHLPIPAWLNEGIAVTVEDEICGAPPFIMTDERLEEHARFWNRETIQEFWNGVSFSRADKGFNLSYELARYCVLALAPDYKEFKKFANAASYEDGGEAAANEAFGFSLGGPMEQLFGEGDWKPESSRWGRE